MGGLDRHLQHLGTALGERVAGKVDRNAYAARCARRRIRRIHVGHALGVERSGVLVAEDVQVRADDGLLALVLHRDVELRGAPDEDVATHDVPHLGDREVPPLRRPHVHDPDGGR